MSDVLLTLVMPADLAQTVEDLLLCHPDLVAGFTANHGEGHGPLVDLQADAERVAGHAPRTTIRTLGRADDMQALLAVLRGELAGAGLFYWIVPVLERGRL